MLVKITTQCSMGCRHCMESAKSVGEHMDVGLFERVVEFVSRVDGERFMLISGGEPFEHPEFFGILDRVKGWRVIVLSNGEGMTEGVVERIVGYGFYIQVINDKRYYPRRVNVVKNERVLYEEEVVTISPFGRARENGLESSRSAPLCFNLRSCVRYERDFERGLRLLRQSGKFCSPSVDVRGNVLVGECRECYKVGTVESSVGELTMNVLGMECNRCGLEDNLSLFQKRSIY